jgi:hypothetical protein
VQELVESGKETKSTIEGAHTWLTEEGPVTIHQEGDELLITESLDQPTMQKLDQELFAATALAGH